MTVDIRTVVTRTPALLSTPVDDEIVILNPDRGNYVALNATGRAIWNLIEQPRPAAEICLRLSRAFDASPDQIEADMLPFLTEIVREGIARVAEP